jgi:hypothetical protein
LNVSVRDVAVDGAGTRTFATPSGKLTDGTPAITGTIAGLSGSGSGALHPTLGLAYHAATTAVSLYNLTTLSKVGQVPLGDSVSTATPNNGIGRMDLSPDGRVLAVITNGGFSVVEPFAAGPPDHLELARNGSFAIGASGWQTFALPDPGYFQGGVTDGVMEFNRLAPPPGQPTQATIFQNTGVPLPSGAPIRAQFDLGNSSSARKRISVLLVDADFSDISVCTFWLQPNTALATYRMSSHTTRPWVNASIYFYAATDGSDGGYNRLDNVSLSFDSSVVPDRTTCEDPTTPAATGDADGPDLLVNGDFVSGTSAAWTIFGTLTPQVSDGVFEFIRPTGAAPAGVILQPTGATVAAGEMFTATFDLGNSSAVRKRVTVLLHDLDFSDLSACTFWLEPGQALSPYSMRAFATKAWANATVSFYAATVGVDGWTRLDNSTLRRTPSAVITGSECVEPGGSNAAPPTAAVTNSAPQSATPPAAKTASSVAVSSAPAERGGRGHADVISRQVTGESVFEFNGAATVSVALLSRLTGDASTGQIQISLDGEHWDTIAVVDSADDGSRILIDLASWPGASVRLRFVLNKPSGDSTVKWLIQWAADASRGRER